MRMSPEYSSISKTSPAPSPDNTYLIENSPRSESDLSYKKRREYIKAWFLKTILSVGTRKHALLKGSTVSRTWRTFNLKRYLANNARSGIFLGDKQLFPDPASLQATVQMSGPLGQLLGFQTLSTSHIAQHPARNHGKDRHHGQHTRHAYFYCPLVHFLYTSHG